MAEKWKGRCWLLHGFNVRDPMRSVGKLIPYLEQEDIEPRLWRYGWTGLLMVRFFDKRFARMLADSIEPGDFVIAHSNGCAIAHLAAQMGAPIERMAYINPALDEDALLPKQVQRLDVWHVPSELPTRLSRLLLFHPWGKMGAVGYRGRYDHRITNHDMQHSFPSSVTSHSGVFQQPQLRFFAPRIVQRLIQ